MSPQEIARAVRAAQPDGGLFHEKDWRVGTEPFPLDAHLAGEIEKLGYRLRLFVSACDLLYRLSTKGRAPEWVAGLVDRGKPAELVAFQREHTRAGEIPLVLRPDLVLTDAGFVIAEIDSVPGGIGLTAWLNEQYSRLGFDVTGGPTGMIDAFAAVLGNGDIVVSEEAATYRPEMEWIAARAGGRRVVDASPRDDWAERVYRFFEHFDLANVPCAEQLMSGVKGGRITVTPPFKPALEEKLWFALFWLKPLEDFWLRELGGKAFEALRRVIPYTWLVDPEPLPRHAVLPRLEAHSWSEVAKFSQKRRQFILKISGFSERAWGSRGVVVASDLPQREWQTELERALGEFGSAPHILQEFHPGRLVEAGYLDAGSDEIRTMRGRVRLCPYFFLAERSVAWGGTLATICPDDKKLLHGMRDAILVPAAVRK